MASEVKPADQGDTKSGPETLKAADENLLASGNETSVQACVADKGYHDTAMISELPRQGIRMYIPERRQRVRRWTDKPEAHQKAFRGNRRRVTSARGRRLSRWRSERCERTFAHVCETGGGRRVWVRGLEEVAKLHRVRYVAYNLGLLLRKVFVMMKPRSAGMVLGGFIGALMLIGTLIAIGITGFLTWILGFTILVFIYVVVRRRFPARTTYNSLKPGPSLTGVADQNRSASAGSTSSF